MASVTVDTTDLRLIDIVCRLVNALRPERIYWFGSRARGDATSQSDFDVLVVVNRAGEYPYQLEQLAYRALSGLETPVHVVVISQERFEQRRYVVGSLPAPVDREGKLLYAA